MKRSLLRLVVVSVLAAWLASLVVTVVYGYRKEWTETSARRHGVFLAFELLDPLPVAERAQRLDQLEENFGVEFELLTLAELDERIGSPRALGTPIAFREDWRRHWFFLAFTDGSGALAAGPFNPSVPVGYAPVGLIAAAVVLPALAAFIALRVERELNKVERASRALSEGRLSVRVDNRRGPSNELAASFNEMAGRIEELIRSRDELVQAVSHELGSPLSRLRFYVELVATPGLSEERLKDITRELDALDELVAELLSYVQSDDVDLQSRAFAPTPVLRDLGELARLDAADEREVAVEDRLPAETLLVADPKLFSRAIENLLRNAVRYAQARVRIEISETDRGIDVAVHDDGPGIPKEMREKVTAPFVRLEASRERKTGGVGLGLAIVSRIVRRHGGELAIGSSPLGGALVSTQWPKRRGATLQNSTKVSSRSIL